MSVVENLNKINHIVETSCQKVNRNPDDITIIAVTKYVSSETAKEAFNAGILNLGENRTDDLLRKQSELASIDVKWHFIGTLQSRKVKDIVHHVAMIHSLDRLSVAKQIEKRAAQPVDCFIQVNVSEESSKHGLSVDEVMPFIEKLNSFEKVNVVGLMTMAPHIADREKLRGVFRSLKQLQNKVEALNYNHAPCHYVSMGMSNDFDIAIEEGATHIRIGTKLVGSELKGE